MAVFPPVSRLSYVTEDEFVEKHTDKKGVVDKLVMPYYELEKTLTIKDDKEHKRGMAEFSKMMKAIHSVSERTFLKREVARCLFKHEDALERNGRVKSEVISKLGVDHGTVIYFYKTAKLRREVARDELLNPVNAKKYTQLEEKILVDIVENKEMLEVKDKNGNIINVKPEVTVREKMTALAKLTAAFTKSIQPVPVTVRTENAIIDASHNKVIEHNINFGQIRGNDDEDVIRQIRAMKVEEGDFTDLEVFKDS